MACEGYEHGSRVALDIDIPSIQVPVGAVGTVVAIRSDVHKIDVDFDDYGRINNLDAHSFVPHSDGGYSPDGGTILPPPDVSSPGQPTSV
jgi:hypothetical protein